MAADTLLSALNIGREPALVSIVGAGGKTSLLFALGQALGKRVVLTTTTRIFATQMKEATAVCTTTNLNTLGDKLAEFGQCLVVGEVQGEKAYGVPPELPGQLLAHPDVDYVIVEADGSRMRPVKAPADHEPVVPPETTLLVPMVGIDALNSRIADIAHRPERVVGLLNESERFSVNSEQYLTQAMIAFLLTHPQGGLKDVPFNSQIIPFINKVETAVQLQSACQIAYHILHDVTRFTLHISRPAQVVIAALQTRQPHSRSSSFSNGRYPGSRPIQAHGTAQTTIILGKDDGVGAGNSQSQKNGRSSHLGHHRSRS